MLAIVTGQWVTGLGPAGAPWTAGDGLGELIEPLLPSWPTRAPGPEPVEDRRCRQPILVVLRTGIGGQDLPAELELGSGMTCWRRPTVLAMLAHAFLAPTTTSTSLPATLIRLTCGPIRRLRQALTAPSTPTISHALHWSPWRRHAQARTRTSHYQQQTLTE